MKKKVMFKDLTGFFRIAVQKNSTLSSYMQVFCQLLRFIIYLLIQYLPPPQKKEKRKKKPVAYVLTWIPQEALMQHTQDAFNKHFTIF